MEKEKDNMSKTEEKQQPEKSLEQKPSPKLRQMLKERHLLILRRELKELLTMSDRQMH